MRSSPEQKALPAADGWFESPLGAALLDAENEAADRLLERVFGFVAVSIGDWWPCAPFLGACAIRRQLRIQAGGDIVSPLDNLALASDSVDAVLLPHTLEFVASPQRMLRETERVLVGEGHVLILGFNPWSAWSARRTFCRAGHFPESGRPLAARRLVDWLKLLGFEVLAVESVFRRPPVNHAAVLEHLALLEKPRWLPLPGSCYAILARKHVYSLTPVRPAWERRRRLVAGIASPARRTQGAANFAARLSKNN